MSNKSFCSICGKLLREAPPLSDILPWIPKDKYKNGLYACEDHVYDKTITVKNFTNKKPTKEGQYFYMYPKWEHPVIVKIIKEDNKLYVDFNDNELDLLLEDCDKNVLWFKIEK